MKISVLIVDDSAVVRQTISAIISEEDDMEVIGTAPDPYYGAEKIAKKVPDVIILDLEMPRMGRADIPAKNYDTAPHPGNNMLKPCREGFGLGIQGPVMRRSRGDRQAEDGDKGIFGGIEDKNN